jgi:hypothetical protein
MGSWCVLGGDEWVYWAGPSSGTWTPVQKSVGVMREARLLAEMRRKGWKLG